MHSEHSNRLTRVRAKVTVGNNLVVRLAGPVDVGLVGKNSIVVELEKDNEHSFRRRLIPDRRINSSYMHALLGRRKGKGKEEKCENLPDSKATMATTRRRCAQKVGVSCCWRRHDCVAGLCATWGAGLGRGSVRTVFELSFWSRVPSK